MAKFAPTQSLKPQDIAVGHSIDVHAKSLATFKTYVSRYNKDKQDKMRFQYADFIGTFCKATRIS